MVKLQGNEDIVFSPPASMPGAKGMYLDPRQIPVDLKEPAMDAGQPPEPPLSLTVTISGPQQQAHDMLAYIRGRYGEQAPS